MGTDPDTAKRYNYGVDTVFRACKSVANVNDVKEIAHLLAANGFHPAPAIQPGYGQDTQDINRLVDAYHANLAAENRVLSGLMQTAGFPLYMESFPATMAKSAFQWMLFKGGYVQVTLSGWVEATEAERRERQEPFAQALLAVAKKIYPLVRPEYGFIEDPDVDGHPPGDKFVKRREIVALNWVNFFGPDYVAKYGRELLANIPGYRTEDLPDGGLLYQSRASIVPESELAHRRWRKEAQRYLTNHGITIRFGYGYG